MRFLHAGITVCAFTAIFAFLCLLGALITGILDMTLNGRMEPRAHAGLLAGDHAVVQCRTLLQPNCTEIE